MWIKNSQDPSKFFSPKWEKKVLTYINMLDTKRWDVIILIIFFVILIVLFTRCSIKCGANGESYGPIYPALSSMGWPVGIPVNYPDVNFGDIGLYYFKGKVRNSQAYDRANSLGGTIVGGDCIRMMIKKGALVSDTPLGLLYACHPSTTGKLCFGGIRNGKFTTNDLVADGDAEGDGLFIYGPVPEYIGIPVHSDPDAYYSRSCDINLKHEF